MTRQHGFSLIELLVGLVVLGVILSGLSMLLQQGYRQLSYSRSTQNAFALAELYMEEILATGRWDERSERFGTPGGIVWPESLATIGPEENSRSAYDDIDDYHGSVFSAPHQSKSGVALGDQYAGFETTISVRFQTLDGSDSGTATDIKHIEVEVTWGTDQSIILRTLLTNT